MSTLDELIREGEARGQAEGQINAKADALITILRARSLPVSEADRSRIVACTDVTMLDRWIRRAATATSTSEVFAQEV